MSSSLAYQPRLDGLRFIAVFCVLLFHFAAPVGKLFSSGTYGVNLFFVLSGFLITSILIKERDESFGTAYKNFIGRRALRIFPIYYLSLFALILLSAPNILSRLPWLISYTYNLYVPYHNLQQDYYRHFWSLSVEEQFYVFFPILILTMKRNLKALLLVCIVLILTGWSQAVFNIFNIAGSQRQIFLFNYYSLLTNMAPLCLGATGAILTNMKKLPRFFASWEAELAAFVILVYSLVFLSWKYQLVICSITNCYLIMKAWQGGFSFSFLNKLTTQPVLVYLGRISYGIYIFHNIIRGWMDTQIVDPIWTRMSFDEGSVLQWLQHHTYVVKFPVYSLLTIGLAHLSFKWIEKPLLRLKDVYFGHGAKGQVSEPEILITTEARRAQRGTEFSVAEVLEAPKV